MEDLGSGIKRNDSETWVNTAWPGLPDMGFFVSYGGAHTKASWFMRTRPKLKEAFAKIWGTNFKWTPYVENLHCDQNPSSKKGFHCVQGMVPLYKVDEVGGLMVVPNTNNDHVQEQLVDRYPYTESTNSDWLELRA
jgi:hypothetical protein